jgi:putative addiction module component (TIGR02574 family)
MLPTGFWRIVVLLRRGRPLLLKKEKARTATHIGYRLPMPVSVPLDKMTVEEKLQLMEAIWEDLSRDEESVESPEWHRVALEERRQKEARGETSYIPWEQAKEELRRRINER